MVPSSVSADRDLRGDADGSAGRVQLRFRSGNVRSTVDQIDGNTAGISC